MHKILIAVILSIIFFTPLLGEANNFGYEQIKVLFFSLSTFLAAIIWIFNFTQYKKRYPITVITNLQLLFILILVITSLVSIDLSASLFGVDPYFQGIVFYVSLLIFSLLVFFIPIKTEYYAVCLVLSSSAVSLIALRDWIMMNVFHQVIINYAGRVVSTFGQPNFYAGFVLMTIPFSYLLVQKKSRYLQAVGVISCLLSILAVLVSESRTSAALLIFLFLIWLFSKIKTYKKVFAGAFIVVFVSALFLSIYLSSGFFWKEFASKTLSDNPDLTSDSVEKRPYLWITGLKVISLRPISGYGIENIKSAYSDYFQSNKHQLFEENLKVSSVLISLKDLTIDRSHNYFLDLLLFSGVFGLFTWIILYLVIFKNAQNPILQVCLLVYLIWIQFQNQSAVHLIYFWLIAGLINRK